MLTARRLGHAFGAMLLTREDCPPPHGLAGSGVSHSVPGALTQGGG